MNYKDIAIVCHEANKAYCDSLGDHSQVYWDDVPSWQLNSAVDGVRAIREGRIRMPSQSHENWLKGKVAEGWTYGPVKDPENKRHPCIMPFRDLPPDQQAKDHLFFAIATALIPLID